MFEGVVPDVSKTRPRISADQVVTLVQDRFGVAVQAEELPSERDRVFALRDGSGRRAWSLRVANSAEDERIFDLQDQAAVAAAGTEGALVVPAVVATLEGTSRTVWRDEDRGRVHTVRVTEWIDGEVLAAVRPHSVDLLHDLGRGLGRLDRAWQALDLDVARREFHWNLRSADAVVGAGLGAIDASERRALVEQRATEWGALAPRRQELRCSVVHQDANDHNVLVRVSGEGLHLAGLIDFGDMAESYTVAELAVAAAYAMMGKRDPLAALRALTRGYHGALPLTENELALLGPMITMRLAQSVVLSTLQQKAQPDHHYLSISAQPAWALLEQWRAWPPALVEAHVRHAAGLEPSPVSPSVVGWLREHADQLEPVVAGVEGSTPVVDLSVGSEIVAQVRVERATADDPWGDPPVLAYQAPIDALAARHGGDLVLGRYGEPRVLYDAEQFAGHGEDRLEPRTVHLGVDVFGAAGTAVHAPLDGTVWAVGHNDLPLDYGPTVILRHAPAGASEFFTLYGHLARDSITHLEVGARVRAGQRLAAFGEAHENGGWPPHLHLQLAVDPLFSQHSGDIPGVARADEQDVWRSLCPSAAMLLPGVVDTDVPADQVDPTDRLRAQRRALFSRAMSVSYARPLSMVAGRGASLFDAGGRRYLDAVNNVPHVGHSHPAVVRAGQRQMAVLNTNTRYLHPSLHRYAERLLATAPGLFDVCFFVCSGSEANELALRLACAHTGGDGMVVLDGGYHGNTQRLVELSPYKFQGKGGFDQRDHVEVAPRPDPYRGAHRAAGVSDAAAAGFYADGVARAATALNERGHRLAAFLAEPLMGCGGQIVPPAGYLARAFDAIREAGGVCIADEVQVGFGRVGEAMWAFEAQGARPDVLTLGKPIGNGHPIGAVLTTRAIAESFEGGMEYFNTFGGNPVAAQIGLAVLDVIEGEGLRERARDVGAYLLRRLAELADRHALIGDVRGQGLYLGVELVGDRERRTPAAGAADYVVQRMRDAGILLSTDGPDHNVLKIKPPLCFSEREADRLVGTLDRVFGETPLSHSALRM